MLKKHHKDANKMINERLKEWESGKSMYEAKSSTGKSKNATPRLVVTISREAGCDAHAVAEILSDKLGLSLYDRQIIEMIAKDKEVATRVVATLDEKGQSELTNWVNESLMGLELSSAAYFESLKKVLFTIVSHRNAVIVGRGANVMFPPEKRVAIRLVAPFETRVKHVMEQNDFTAKRARTFVTKVDEERRQFIRKYWDRDICDSTLNDVVINMATVKPDAIVGIVKAIHENSAMA
jgi:cytidylate kinase